MAEYNWSVWEKFSDYSKNPATPEQTQAVKIVLVKMVQDQIQKYGATGTKRKRALRAFRECISPSTASNYPGNIREAVQAAIKLGVPYEHMTSIATLLT
jgi:hypothetical protein